MTQRSFLSILLATLLPWLMADTAWAISVDFWITPETCGNANGSVQANVSGGTPPYEYLWSNASSTSTITGLAAGSYSLTVTDANFDVVTDNAEVWNSNTLLWSEGGYYLYEEGLPWGGACPGECNGALTMPAAVLGGIAPYGFTWNASGPIVPAGVTSQMDQIWSGFCQGEPVTYTYEDATGCQGAGSFIVFGVSPSEIPSISSVQGACQGGANGSVTVFVPIAVVGAPRLEVYADGGLEAWLDYPAPGAESTIGGLAAGDYELVATWLDMCPQAMPFVVPDLGPDCGTISGRVFVDYDLGCSEQVGEPAVPGAILQVLPGPFYTSTDAQGNFGINLAYGDYSIEQVSSILAEHCTDLSVPFTLSGGSQNVVQDFADTSLVPLDLEVMLNSGLARPGFPMTYALVVRNLTPDESGPVTLTFTFEALLGTIDVEPAPTSVVGNTLTWEFNGLIAFEEWSAWVTLQVPPDVGLLGTVLEATANAVSVNSDADPANNTATNYRTITGAYDPNDKLARTSSAYSDEFYFIDVDAWVDYTIRFQNTGTDTAFNVIVTDTLPADLDPSGIVIGAASHAFTWELRGEGTLVFSFEDILLPDSNVNEAASHGFVGFRIQPRLPLLPGTVIGNTANIFFDFNPPVITDPSVLTAEFSTGVPEPQRDIVLVHPNPTTGVLNIRFPEGPLDPTLHIHAADGRLVRVHRASGNSTAIDLDDLHPGVYTLKFIAAPHLTTRFVIH